MPDLVAQVRHFLASGIPDSLFGIDAVVSAVALGIKLHVVEDEELRFGPEHCRVSQTSAAQEFLGALRDPARVPSVGFLGARLRDGACQRQGWLDAEGINKGRGRIRHRQHVGSFNALPTADARTVEAQSFAEDLFGQFADGTAEVLPGAKRVDEFNVDHLGTALFS